MKTILSLCPIATVDKYGVYGRMRYEEFKFGATNAEFHKDLGLIEWQGGLYYGSLYRVPDSLPLVQTPYYAELEPYLAQIVFHRTPDRAEWRVPSDSRDIPPAQK